MLRDHSWKVRKISVWEPSMAAASTAAQGYFCPLCSSFCFVFFPTVSGYNQQLQPCGGCLWQAGIFFKSIFSCLGWTAERLCEWMSDHVPGMVQTSVSSWPVVAQAAVTSVGNLSSHFSTLFSLKFSVGVLGKRSTLARCRIWYSGI